jgi:hypothetical protein
LKQLQRLRVVELTLADPAHLASLTHLQRLCLRDGRMLPFEADEGGPSAQGTLALLGALDSLPNLEHLSLGPAPGPGFARVCLDTEQNHRQFSSLTASSKLTSLQLSAFRKQPLPRRAASCIFSQLLSQLQQLCIWVSLDRNSPRCDAFGGGCCISKADLRCIVRSCPSLQRLDLRCTFTPGKDVSALRGLQACRVLIVGGRGFAYQQAEVIGQLTWLTELQWHDSSTLTHIGTEQLTTLTNLNRLCVQGGYGVVGVSYFELLSQPDKVRCLTLPNTAAS